MNKYLQLFFLMIMAQGLVGQNVVSEIPVSSKHSTAKLLTLENGDIVAWTYPIVRKDNQMKKAQLQLAKIEDQKNQWSVSIEAKDDFFLFFEKVVASPDGKYVYAIYHKDLSVKEYYQESRETRVVQVDENGEKNEFNIKAGKYLDQIEVVFCDEKYLYFLCAPEYTMVDMKKIYNSYELKLIKLEHETGDYDIVDVDLPEVQSYGGSLWHFEGIHESLLYFISKSYNHNTSEVKVKLASVNEIGKTEDVITSTIRLNDQLETHNLINANGNSHIKPRLVDKQPEYGVVKNLLLKFPVTSQVDFKNDRMYFVGCQGGYRNPTVFIGVYNLEGDEIALHQELPLFTFSSHPGFSDCLLEVDPTGGFLYYGFTSTIHKIDLDGKISTRPLELLANNSSTALLAHQYYYNTPCAEYVQARNKGTKLSGMTLSNVGIFWSSYNGHEYYGTFDKKAKMFKIMYFRSKI